MITKKCIHCKKDFVANQYQSTKKYCSEKCKTEVFRRKPGYAEKRKKYDDNRRAVEKELKKKKKDLFY